MMNDLPELLSKFAELPLPNQDDVLTLVRCIEPDRMKSNFPTILFKNPSSLEIISKGYAIPSRKLDRFFEDLQLASRVIKKSWIHDYRASKHADRLIPRPPLRC